VALHISVNVLNDYYDFKTGIDLKTRWTPFSGGSGLLPAGKISPVTTFKMGLISLGVGSIIGLYFLIRTGWIFFPILLLGIASVYFYNPVISKFLLGETAAGLGLGLLPVMGTYLVITGMLTPLAFFASIPPFLLTFNLLFLNEFPDAEADKSGGRHHLVIFLGKEKAGILYAITTLAVYLWIMGGVAARAFPLWTLLAMFTFPVGIRAIKGALVDYNNFEKFIQAQQANVIVVLLTQALFALGFFIGGL
jgi:1,4-dihydroxy-2-naphthoate octaprenyltransferase